MESETPQPAIGKSGSSGDTSPPLNPSARTGGTEAKPKKGVAGGSTFAPHTTIRKPMTYNLIESELKIVSHLNGVAVAAFSFGSFWLSLLLSILISYCFTADPVPMAATILLNYGTWPCLVMTLGSYALGIWSVVKRTSMVQDIKDETKVV
jgi:hypothetical protein